MTLLLLLTAETPLAVRAGRAQDVVQAHPYIPGSALFGSLASVHSLLRPTRRDEFAAFFLDDALRYDNLYPASFASQELTDDAQPVYPLPRSAWSCKRFPGFRFNAEREQDARHGIADNLMAWAVYALSAGQETSPLEALRDCSDSACGEPADRANGFYRRGLLAQQAGLASTQQRIRTRTGISRTTGAAAQGIL